MVRAATYDRLTRLRASILRAGTAALPKELAGPDGTGLGGVMDFAVRAAERVVVKKRGRARAA